MSAWTNIRTGASGALVSFSRFAFFVGVALLALSFGAYYLAVHRKPSA